MRLPTFVAGLLVVTNMTAALFTFVSRAQAQQSSSQGTFNVKDYGAIGDGIKDDTAALVAAINAANSAGGGEIYFPPGRYLITGQIAIPNDGGATPKQNSLRLSGAGPSHNGEGFPPLGGSILDLRYGGPVAKIDTRGLGFLEVDRLTLTDGGTSSTPFIQTTNTTLHVHDVEFYGSKVGTFADQDAIILGGTTGNLGGTADAMFQGYGTIIEHNYFNRIRRGVYARSSANANVIRENTFWNQCGSNLGGGAAAIDLEGIPSSSASGNIVSGNLIEMSSYVYGVRLAGLTVNNVVVYNNFYDPGEQTLAFVRFEATAAYNLVIEGYGWDHIPLVSDATTDRNNSVLRFHQSMPSLFQQPMEFNNTVTIRAPFGSGVVVEDPAGEQHWWQSVGSPGHADLRLRVKPASAPMEEVARFLRASPTGRTFSLLGTGSNSIDSFGELRLLAAPGETLWLGDPVNLNVSVTNGQVISTLSDGLPPFLVASTTPVQNLTVERCDHCAIGGGTAITKHLSVVGTLDFPSLAPRKCDALKIKVTGAKDGDSVSLGIPNALASDARATFFGWVAEDDTVTVRRCNVSRDTTTDPPPATVRVDIWKH